ncbi:hypothetical protein IGK66_002824 [Enterococcus sp. DIV0188]
MLKTIEKACEIDMQSVTIILTNNQKLKIEKFQSIIDDTILEFISSNIQYCILKKVFSILQRLKRYHCSFHFTI